jgi:hypothetical protein
MIEKDPPKRMACPGSLSPQRLEGFAGRFPDFDFRIHPLECGHDRGQFILEPLMGQVIHHVVSPLPQIDRICLVSTRAGADRGSASPRALSQTPTALRDRGRGAIQSENRRPQTPGLLSVFALLNRCKKIFVKDGKALILLTQKCFINHAKTSPRV